MTSETRQQALDRFNEFAEKHKNTLAHSPSTEELLRLANHQEKVIQEMRKVIEGTITSGVYLGKRKYLYDALTLADAPYKGGE